MGASKIFGYCPECGLEWNGFGPFRERVSIHDYLYTNPHVLGIKCPCGFELPRKEAMNGKWG